MANDNTKNPFTLSRTAGDGTVTLKADGISMTFKNDDALRFYATELYRQASERQTHMFHLQDTADGHLLIVNHKGGSQFRVRDCEQARKAAAAILDALGDRTEGESDHVLMRRTEVEHRMRAYANEVVDQVHNIPRRKFLWIRDAVQVCMEIIRELQPTDED